MIIPISRMATPRVGSRVILISKSGIRYEGVLGAVASKMITLTKPQAFAVDDTQAEHLLPPLNDFVGIIFKTDNIKEMYEDEKSLCNGSLFDDPAIVSFAKEPNIPVTNAPAAAAFTGGASSTDISASAESDGSPPVKSEMSAGSATSSCEPAPLRCVIGPTKESDVQTDLRHPAVEAGRQPATPEMGAGEQLQLPWDGTSCGLPDPRDATGVFGSGKNKKTRNRTGVFRYDARPYDVLSVLQSVASALERQAKLEAAMESLASRPEDYFDSLDLGPLLRIQSWYKSKSVESPAVAVQSVTCDWPVNSTGSGYKTVAFRLLNGPENTSATKHRRHKRSPIAGGAA